MSICFDTLQCDRCVAGRAGTQNDADGSDLVIYVKVCSRDVPVDMIAHISDKLGGMLCALHRSDIRKATPS